MRPPGKSIFVIACLAATAAPAVDLCPVKEDNTNCSRILACFGDDGTWFHGRSIGRGTGVVGGVLSDGTICRGTWVSENSFGLGQADVECDDGVTVTVIFTVQDGLTGTVTGYGQTSDGRKVTALSGLHVLDYFSKETGLPNGVFRCGQTEIPIS